MNVQGENMGREIGRREEFDSEREASRPDDGSRLRQSRERLDFGGPLNPWRFAGILAVLALLLYLSGASAGLSAVCLLLYAIVAPVVERVSWSRELFYGAAKESGSGGAGHE